MRNKIKIKINAVRREGVGRFTGLPLWRGWSRKAYEKFFEDHDGNLSNVYGDDEFNSKWFKAFNDVLNVNVHTGVAKDDHISKYSDRLGIIDRLVRTLRKLMNKYMLLPNTTQWSKWLPEIISVYNKTPHASLNDRTPDEASADVNRWRNGSGWICNTTRPRIPRMLLLFPSVIQSGSSRRRRRSPRRVQPSAKRCM